VKRRLSFLCLLFLPGLVGLVTSRGGQTAVARPAQALTPRTVVLAASGVSDEQLLVLSAALAAADQPPVLLMDNLRLRVYHKLFLTAYHADQVIPVGTFPEGEVELLPGQLGAPVRPALEWDEGRPEALWKLLFPKAQDVVVCPEEPRSLLLHAACLAGSLRAPLFVYHGDQEEITDLQKRLAGWGTRRVHAVGAAVQSCRRLKNVSLLPLEDERAVAVAHQQQLLKQGPIPTVVATNPRDLRQGRPGISSFAPWIALQRRAALVLTDSKGNPTAALTAAQENPRLKQTEYLILAGDPNGMPMERRPNPLPTHEQETPLEPPYPGKDRPFTWAAGRLFHREVAVVPLTLARERLLADVKGPRKALVVGNAGGVLPLLEVIVRDTAQEFRNAGYQTTTMYRQEPNYQNLHQQLPLNDIFVWEGHHLQTMASLGAGRQPLRPSLIFLQSCVALQEANCLPLIERGAVAVVAPASYTFSASGGAFAHAYFDAMFYEGQSLGGALREAKNFLLTYAQLKEKRLGQPSKKGGANIRSAWAFTLWGDPTLKLPVPTPPKGAHQGVQAQVKGNYINISLPEEKYDKMTSTVYQAVVWPNGRLAGLMKRLKPAGTKDLLPMVYAEVRLPQGAGQGEPRLSTRLPGDRWVFLWDPRRLTGYLLARPRTRDREELRFHVQWED
jgi:hypothetical protein